MAPRRAAAAAATQSMAQANQAPQAGPSGGAEAKKVGRTKAAAGAGLAISATLPTRQDPPVSPIIAKLRRSWQFAAVCQFLFTFDEAFGMSGFETEALERDLDGAESGMLPDLVRRMLYTLTLDRHIDTSNWEHYLRLQYLVRSPNDNPLGSLEQPRVWAAMGLTQKIKALWSLCEWQLVDSERFRKLVKSEEEPEVWRIEPVGWDSEDNTYWLFDDNRLWVQHTEPAPPPKPKALPPPKKGSKRARAEARASRKPTSDNATQSPTHPAARNTSGAKRGRTSDAAQSVTPAKRPRASETATIARPASARTSRRLRGAAGDEEGGWQAVPSDVLQSGGAARNGRRTRTSRGAGSSSDSDLSEPPEEEGEDDGAALLAPPRATSTEDVEMADVSTTDATFDDSHRQVPNGHLPKVEGGADESAAGPTIDAATLDSEQSAKVAEVKSEDTGAGNEAHRNGASRVDAAPELLAPSATGRGEDEDSWVEFETVAVTRLEWEDIAVRFAKSKHPDEKAFHAYLQESVIPRVMADFDAVDKQRAIEAALASRKRSSRIAMKESEREERERDKAARLEMEERMARLRAEDKERRDRDREANEVQRAREDRAKEREERIHAREREAEERAIKEVEAREARERMREDRARKREEIIANGGIPPKHDDPRAVAAEAVEQGIEPTEDENWELACEVCGKAGVNLDDASEIVCCESCGVWQHTDCWNAFDRSIKRSPRDWNQIDFYCSRCRPPHPDEPWPARSKPKTPASPRPRIKVKQLGPDPSQSPAPAPASAPSPSPLAQQTQAAHADAPFTGDSMAPSDVDSRSTQASTAPFDEVKPVSNGVRTADSRPKASVAPVVEEPSSRSSQSTGPAVAPLPAETSKTAPAANAANVGAGADRTAPASPTSSHVASTATRTSPMAEKGPSSARSPGAYTPKGTGGSGNASGSFPIRRAPLRSPLSGPYPATSNPVPGISLGPARATSPTPSGQTRATGGVTADLAATHTAATDPLMQRQKTSVMQPPVSSGPGPVSGSLARTPAPSVASRSNGMAPALSPRSGSVFGPSPPRLAYGSPGAAAAASAASSQAALTRALPSAASAPLSVGAPLPSRDAPLLAPTNGQTASPRTNSHAQAPPAITLASTAPQQAAPPVPRHPAQASTPARPPARASDQALPASHLHQDQPRPPTLSSSTTSSSSPTSS